MTNMSNMECFLLCVHKMTDMSNMECFLLCVHMMTDMSNMEMLSSLYAQDDWYVMSNMEMLSSLCAQHDWHVKHGNAFFSMCTTWLICHVKHGNIFPEYISWLTCQAWKCCHFLCTQDDWHQAQKCFPCIHNMTDMSDTEMFPLCRVWKGVCELPCVLSQTYRIPWGLYIMDYWSSG